MHSAYVVIASFVAGVCPVHSVHFILSIASLISTAVYLVARSRFRIHALGLVVAPLGLVVTLGTFFLGSASPDEQLPASFIGLHVFASLVGDALFLLACAAAVSDTLEIYGMPRSFRTSSVLGTKLKAKLGVAEDFCFATSQKLLMVAATVLGYAYVVQGFI